MAEIAQATLWQRFQLWRELRAQGVALGWRLPNAFEYRQYMLLSAEHPGQLFRSAQDYHNWQELQGLRHDRAQIDAISAAIRQEIEGEIVDAGEHIRLMEKDGLQVGESLGLPRKERLYTGGDAGDSRAPKIHPLWSDDLRRETEHLRAIGEPIIFGLRWNDDQPWERDTKAWPYTASFEQEMGIAPGQAPRFYYLDAHLVEQYRQGWYEAEQIEQGVRQDLKEQGIPGRVMIMAEQGASFTERQLFEVDMGGVHSQAFLAWEQQQQGELDQGVPLREDVQALTQDILRLQERVNGIPHAEPGQARDYDQGIGD
jgi:hypothetical protein